jgi:sulfate permease, SulP family
VTLGTTFTHLKGDVAGGVWAALFTLPANIALGMIAFGALGPDHMGQGILAGMYASVLGGFLAALLGGSPGLVTCALAPTTLAFAAVLASLAASGGFTSSSPATAAYPLALAYGVVLLAGVFQILFGVFRLGRLVKYVAYPVVAGILNGTALVLILSQAGAVLGTPGRTLGELVAHPGRIEPLAAVVAGTTLILVLAGARLSSRIPPLLLALGGGTALYYGLYTLHGTILAGPTLTAIPSGLPTLAPLQNTLNALSRPEFLSDIFRLLPAALAVGILGSLITLMGGLKMEAVTGRIMNANRELMGQGVGNFVNGLAGAIPSGGFGAASVAAHRAGGRRRITGVACSATLLLIVTTATPAMEYLPHAVMAGLVLGLALNLADRWSLLLVPRLLTPGVKKRGHLLLDLGTMTVVAMTAVVFGVIMAVALGVAISLAVFAARMSRSVIHRNRQGSTTHSMKKRNKALMELLFTHGDSIAVLELEGALFFGNTDTLAREIDRLCRLEGVRYLILDMRRVSGVDCSAARVLRPTIDRLGEKGIVVAMSHVHPEAELWDELRDAGLSEAFREEYLFQDTGLALEYFEDELLQGLGAAVAEEAEIPFTAFLESEGMMEEDIQALEGYFRPWDFASGETVFCLGDPGDSMYYLQKGSADVLLPLPGGQRSRKLQILTSGTIFGEMGLVDGRPRRADIVARTPLTCLRLPRDRFERLQAERPELAIRLLVIISRAEARNVRLSTEMLQELES